jgi:hypothetical protein
LTDDTDDERIERMAVQISIILRENCEKGPMNRTRIFECLNALGLVGGMVIEACPNEREKRLAATFLLEAFKMAHTEVGDPP